MTEPTKESVGGFIGGASAVIILELCKCYAYCEESNLVDPPLCEPPMLSSDPKVLENYPSCSGRMLLNLVRTTEAYA